MLFFFSKQARDQQGFTLIEVLLVITLMGIIFAYVVGPQYVDLQQEAFEVQRDSTAIAVRDGIHGAFSDAVLNGGGTWPANLDSAPVGACVTQADSNQMCFAAVLQIGVVRDWNKAGPLTYVHTPTGSSFFYNPAAGTFVCTAGC